MTEQHPLTDEKCKDLMQGLPKYASEIEDDDVIKVIRAAADWQLKQVTEFIAAHPMLGEDVALYFFKAMRPQQQEDN